MEKDKKDKTKKWVSNFSYIFSQLSSWWSDMVITPQFLQIITTFIPFILIIIILW